MFCPDCGHELSSETAKFCHRCGGAMPSLASVGVPQAAGYATPPAPGYTPAPPPQHFPQGATGLQPGVGFQPGFDTLTPPKKSKVGLIVGVLFGLVAASAAFFFVRTMAGGSAPSLDEFTAGEGVAFSEPSGRFTVTFPAEPQVQRQNAPLPDGSQIETVMYYVDREPEYAFLAGFTDLGGRPFSLDGAAQGAAATVGGTITSQTPRTVAGVSGQEVHMSVAGTTATMWMGTSGTTLYQLQAIGVSNGHPSIAKFFDSFQPAR